MSMDTSTPVEFVVPDREGLYFVTDGMFYDLSGHTEPTYRSERDMALLRAFLQLALDRLNAPPQLILPTSVGADT